ncbi:MAG: pectate lyase [Prochlorococcus marinus CUG1435]|nr:pectate lyase [Prochlorococcus marinus CUG1435]
MKLIKTPWGEISPEVNLFPIYYLLFIYGFVYIFPYGEDIIGLTWFDLLKIEDGPLEWLQFFEYLISSIFGVLIYFKSKTKNTINSFIWLILSAFCFIVAAEEISWGERITGFSINSLTEISIQSETNLHNLPFFHDFFLDPILIAICILFGWIGWRKWPYLNSIPNKKLSLFFLITALYIFYYEISWASTVEHIRNDLEIYEFLLSTGIFLHFWNNFKLLFKVNSQ